MIRLIFLMLVVVGALAVAVMLFVGMGLYQAAKLQEEPSAAVNDSATRPAMMAEPAKEAKPPAGAKPPVPEVKQKPADLAAAEAPAARAEKPDPAKPMVLSAKDAVLIGDDVKLSAEGEPTIINWLNRTDGVEWTADVAATGLYDIEIKYACSRKDGGGVVTVRAGRGGVTTSVRPTGGWDDYQDQYLGKVYLSEGNNSIYLRPVYLLPGGQLMNLRSVTLTFVKPMQEHEFDSLFRRRRGF